MLIRQAEKSDLQTLSALAVATYTDAFGHSFSPADLAAHLEKYLSPGSFARILEEDVVLVAERAGRLVGFVQFGDVHLDVAGASGDDQELRRLYVQTDLQNQGIGSLLLQAALDHPRLKRAGRIFLDVWEHNHGARRFYERYGFRVIGAQHFQVESGAETSLDLIMVRDALPLG